MKGFVVFAFIAVALGADFDVDITYTCSGDSGTYCTKWEATGKIKEDTAACFPGTSTVITPSGSKLMKDLQVGDLVLGNVDGQDDFAPVKTWLHKEAAAEFEFMRLTTSSNHTLLISPEHLILANDDFVQARSLKVGDRVQTSSSSIATIVSIEKEASIGIFAPYIATGTLYVDGILSHTLAVVPMANVAMKLMNGAMSACEWYYGEESCHGDHHSDSYLHPIAAKFSSLFGLDVYQHRHVYEINGGNVEVHLRDRRTTSNNNNNKENRDRKLATIYSIVVSAGAGSIL